MKNLHKISLLSFMLFLFACGQEQLHYYEEESIPSVSIKDKTQKILDAKIETSKSVPEFAEELDHNTVESGLENIENWSYPSGNPPYFCTPNNYVDPAVSANIAACEPYLNPAPGLAASANFQKRIINRAGDRNWNERIFPLDHDYDPVRRNSKGVRSHRHFNNDDD